MYIEVARRAYVNRRDEASRQEASGSFLLLTSTMGESFRSLLDLLLRSFG